MAGPGINVILPLLCLLTSAPMMAEARQCQVSSDCPAHSPHCSDWGWCQWTDQYGDQGPRDRLETAEAGACSTDKDCSPRFPVCSNLGYCTVKDYFKVMFIKHAVTRQSILGSDDMTLTFMLWLLSECSIALWLISDLERWRLTALYKFMPHRRTYRQYEVLLN